MFGVINDVFFCPACPTTYTGLQKLVPLGLQVKHHAFPGSWKSGASNKQDEKHDVGQGGGHPHHLAGLKCTSQDDVMRDQSS